MINSGKVHYNIMTSSDIRLLKKLPVLLYSLSVNVKNADIDFYFLHRGIEYDELKIYYDYCTALGNIQFHDIKVPDPELYDELAKYGGSWGGEAYYSLCAHLVLPAELDRVLYLDAGDILVLDDIAPYYNDDFEGNALICTAIKYKTFDKYVTGFTQEDLFYEQGLNWIMKGIFNSGSFVINLELLRQCQITMADYLKMLSELKELTGKDSNIYWGDQGFLGAAFAGSVKYYGFPEIHNIFYMPYNFGLWYYGQTSVKPDYKPVIVHFCSGYKPWNCKFPIFLERFQDREGLNDLSVLQLGEAEYHYMWHEYAILADELMTAIEKKNSI